MDQSLPKSERLVRKKRIRALFSEGESFKAFPLRIIYKYASEPGPKPVQVLFSVPKKRLKRPAHRNKVKRRMKEAYRLNKHLIVNTPDESQTLLIGIIYSANNIRTYQTIEKTLIKALEKLNQHLNKDKKSP